MPSLGLWLTDNPDMKVDDRTGILKRDAVLSGELTALVDYTTIRIGIE
jgi:hypothetical protein